MGRASKAEAVRTRVRIVETASEMFRSHGVENVSVADIMGALGLTTGGFYKHFSSKEALAAEAVKLAFDQSSSVWSGLISTGEHQPQDRMKLIDHYLQLAPERKCPMMAFANQSSGLQADSTLREVYNDGSKALLDTFVGAEGAGDAASPSKAKLLFAAMVGARVLKEASGDASWVNDLRDAVLKTAATTA